MSVAMGMGYAGVGSSGGGGYAAAPRPASPRLHDPDATEGEKTYSLFLHLAGLAPLVIGLPLVVTWIMWLVKKNTSPFIDDHGREALNAQISYLVYMLGALALAPITCGVTAAFLVALPILAVIFTIFAAIHAARGEFHRYPITMRFIS